MRYRGLLAPSLIVALVLSAGCSSHRSPFPARPAEVDPSRVPACEMLTEPQRASLQLNNGSPGEVDVNGQRSSGCTWLGEGAVDYNGQYLPVDAAVATTEPDSEVISVNGFGAVQSVPQETFGGTPLCQVTVDAADGRAVRLQALTRPGEPPIGIDEQCRRAAEVASMVMTTVVANASG